MKVIEYLKTHSLEQLHNEYGIKVKEYADRVVLNYHMIDSHAHRGHPIVIECRGLILSLPDYKILCRSFDRFWNYGEDPETINFDISKSICLEKIDGSLINVYHDGKEWCVATRGMAFAEGNYSDNSSETFKELFLEVSGEYRSRFFDLNFCEDYTYIFELVSLESRVVKVYERTQIYFLAVRNKVTGKYVEQEFDRLTYAFTTPKRYNFSTIEKIMESMKDLHALDEGYVCNIGDWRMKIKNPSYLAIAHLRSNDGLSEKRLIHVVWEKQHEEYLTYFNEDRQFFEPYIIAYNKMIGFVEGLWYGTKDIKDQKEFALKVKDTSVGSILFRLRKGQKLVDILKSDKLTDSFKVKILKPFIDKGE